MRSECADYPKDVNEFLDTVLMECERSLTVSSSSLVDPLI
jgi:hypothetical protein